MTRLGPDGQLVYIPATPEEAAAIRRVAQQTERLLQASDRFVGEPPLQGSRMEVARASDLSDGYDLSRACILAAEDHFRTLLVLLMPAPDESGITLPQFAPYTLLRAASVADVRARHLLDLGIPETRRLARALTERLDNLKEQKKALPPDDHFQERVDHLTARAEANGIAVRHERNNPAGPVERFDEPYPSDVDLFERYVPAGSLAFRFLAGHAHSKPWVQIRRDRAKPSEDDPRLAMMSTDLDITLFVSLYEPALKLHDQVIGIWLTLAGYPSEVWHEAKRPPGT